MNFERIWSDVVSWILLAQDTDKWGAVVYAAANFRFPYSSGNFLTSWGTNRSSRRICCLVLFESASHYVMGCEDLVYCFVQQMATSSARTHRR